VREIGTLVCWATRKQYKELLKLHHPDNGGDLQIMQEINAEYDRMFKILKERHENSSADSGTENADYNNMKYDFAEDEKLREILNRIIHFEGMDIELVGEWIWVSGNTYACKKELKELGFRWASQKKMWYWHSEAFRKISRRTLSMDEIRNYYGSTRVQPEKRMLLRQA
jgi:curved DNA-binding protein CbpA